MPVIYEIDEGLGLVLTSCVGEVTLPEVLDHFRMLERDTHWPATLDVLLDFTLLATMPEPEQLREVSKEIGRLDPGVQFRACVMVAPRDVIFGLARMFETFAASRFQATRVCRSRTEAEEWLVSQRPEPPS